MQACIHPHSHTSTHWGTTRSWPTKKSCDQVEANFCKFFQTVQEVCRDTRTPQAPDFQQWAFPTLVCQMVPSDMGHNDSFISSYWPYYLYLESCIVYWSHPHAHATFIHTASCVAWTGGASFRHASMADHHASVRGFASYNFQTSAEDYLARQLCTAGILLSVVLCWLPRLVSCIWFLGFLVHRFGRGGLVPGAENKMTNLYSVQLCVSVGHARGSIRL
jgi:hypothetical protein